VLKKCFDGFCQDGSIHVDTIGTILTMMGLRVKPSALREIIEEVGILQLIAGRPDQFVKIAQNVAQHFFVKINRRKLFCCG
jgi:hypothetical protein